LTFLAGVSTAIGGIIAYFINEPKIKYLSLSLGFSAGVMIYVSFMELMPASISAVGEPISLVGFFIGIVFIGIIDQLIPEEENPHHHELLKQKMIKNNKQIKRTGLFTALAIFIHNFPEGLATFAAALNETELGLIIAIAIALHNIPEGISVSIPIFYSTQDKKKAFAYSFISGIAEPLGAIFGFLILMPFLNEVLISSLLAFVSGIMVYISLDEIIPSAHRFGHSHSVIFGAVFGMAVMALSLVLI
jgi:ZIP family zinc transporter